MNSSTYYGPYEVEGESESERKQNAKDKYSRKKGYEDEKSLMKDNKSKPGPPPEIKTQKLKGPFYVTSSPKLGNGKVRLSNGKVVMDKFGDFKDAKKRGEEEVGLSVRAHSELPSEDQKRVEEHFGQ